MGKSQRAYSGFDHPNNKQAAGFSELMKIYGVKLLQQIAIMATAATALFVGLFIFFG